MHTFIYILINKVCKNYLKKMYNQCRCMKNKTGWVHYGHVRAGKQLLFYDKGGGGEEGGLKAKARNPDSPLCQYWLTKLPYDCIPFHQSEPLAAVHFWVGCRRDPCKLQWKVCKNISSLMLYYPKQGQQGGRKHPSHRQGCFLPSELCDDTIWNF